MASEKPETEPDDVLKLLKGLADDAKAAFDTFKRKLASGGMADPAALAIEVGEVFSILADVSQYAFQAHYEHFDWASEVDEDLDELKDALGGGTTILPEDAARLKATILALAQNLRAPDGDEDVIQALKQQAADAVTFIDESTAEEGDEPDDDEDEEPTE